MSTNWKQCGKVDFDAVNCAVRCHYCHGPVTARLRPSDGGLREWTHHCENPEYLGTSPGEGEVRHESPAAIHDGGL